MFSLTVPPIARPLTPLETMANSQTMGILSFAANVLDTIISSITASLVYLLQKKHDKPPTWGKYASYVVWAREQASIISEGERELHLTINISNRINRYVDITLITMSHLLTTIKEHPDGIDGRAGA